jgi:predicted phosphoribosyltransferase
LEEFVTEYHHYLEAEKMNKTHAINQILGQYGLFDRHVLRDSVVILVSDGLRHGASLDAAVNYLKPVRLKQLVVAVPVASVNAVDRMHIAADEMHVLSATENFLDINHYYDDNQLPSNTEIMQKLDTVGAPVQNPSVAQKKGRTYN